jgi:RNA polymerase sigma-70 factor (ECF subfamily)
LLGRRHRDAEGQPVALARAEVAGEPDVGPLELEQFEHLVGAGDRLALGQLYDRHVRSVYRFARAQLRSSEAAEDATQATFVTLAQRVRSIHLVDGSALPWLIVTCRNHARNRQRAAAREHARRKDINAHELIRTQQDPELEALAGELRIAVNAAIQELSPADQALFKLCIEDGLSYAAAAKTLGVSHGTVRNRLSRIRTRLQRALAPAKEIRP